MFFHALDRKSKRARDILVTLTFRNQLKHLALAWSQAVLRAVTGLFAAQIFRKDVVGDRRRDEGVAAEYGLDREAEL